jgi:hypothetical protein
MLKKSPVPASPLSITVTEKLVWAAPSIVLLPVIVA